MSIDMSQCCPHWQFHLSLSICSPFAGVCFVAGKKGTDWNGCDGGGGGGGLRWMLLVMEAECRFFSQMTLIFILIEFHVICHHLSCFSFLLSINRISSDFFEFVTFVHNYN